MSARCEMTELLVDQCAHCRGNDQTVQEQAEAERREVRRRLGNDPRWFSAVYPGTCERCGERFAAGTLIRMDVSVGWIAECCVGRST